MPEGSSLLALAGGTFLASEATGVTDVTPIGRGDDSGNQPGRDSGDNIPSWIAALLNNQGGGGSGIPPGLIDIIGSQNDAIEDIQGVIGSGQGTGQIPGSDTAQVVQTVLENVPTPSPDDATDVSLGLTEARRQWQDRFLTGFDTPGSGSQPGGSDEEYHIQQDYTGPGGSLIRMGAETGAETGELVDEGVDVGQSFGRQNPYTVAGGTFGSILPVGGTVTGAAVGFGADIVSDAVTGGAPLGAFESPLDVTNEGAWWEGTDYAGNIAGGTQSVVDDAAGGTQNVVDDAVGGTQDVIGDAAGGTQDVWDSVTPDLSDPFAARNVFADGNGTNRDAADEPEEPQGETEGDYGQPTNKLVPTMPDDSDTESGGGDSGGFDRSQLAERRDVDNNTGSTDTPTVGGSRDRRNLKRKRLLNGAT